MKTVAVIPCYNEEKTIRSVAGEALKYVDEVVITDDNSTDKTLEEVSQVRAYYCKNELSARGAGGNTANGLKVARDILKGDVFVTLDGDGQHKPEEIPYLIRPILSGEADISIGTRSHGWNNVPYYRFVGISIINFFYNIGRKNKIHDTQCCFRAFNKKALETLLPVEENGFGFSVEMLVKTQSNGIRLIEVPVDCIYHSDTKQNSTLNPVKHGLQVLYKTLKWRVKMELFK